MLLTSSTLGKVDDQVFSDMLPQPRDTRPDTNKKAAPPSIARLPCDDEDRTQEPAPAGVMVAFMPTHVRHRQPVLAISAFSGINI
ncbi:hypothetical protein E4U22_005416 [Claviceps purpurea]|nr:hypothetical protein E4U34_003276 [Claviceps purpurea]KAG6323751.1 hypothetical protein E4U22_005416 [Claviceps purpurea]